MVPDDRLLASQVPDNCYNPHKNPSHHHRAFQQCNKMQCNHKKKIQVHWKKRTKIFREKNKKKRASSSHLKFHWTMLKLRYYAPSDSKTRSLIPPGPHPEDGAKEKSDKRALKAKWKKRLQKWDLTDAQRNSHSEWRIMRHRRRSRYVPDVQIAIISSRCK